MKTTTKSGAGTKFIGPAILLAAVIALAFMGLYMFTSSPRAAAQSANPTRQSRDLAIRNQRLLELNEGIKPVVTATPVDSNKRLPELNQGYAPTPYRSLRDQRLYELNEGYDPKPFRSPRDQRLYELNR